MLNDQVVTIQEKIRPVLQEAGISRAGLFGSCARGEMNEASDVDILVEFDRDQDMSLLDFIGIEHEIEDVLGREVDLVEYHLLKPRIKDKILRQEVRIYER